MALDTGLRRYDAGDGLRTVKIIYPRPSAWPYPLPIQPRGRLAQRTRSDWTVGVGGIVAHDVGRNRSVDAATR